MMRSFSVGVVLFFSLIFQLKAEGTKELRPTSLDVNDFKISLWSNTNQATRKTGTFFSTAESQYRINIRICNVGEVINLGFNPSANDIFFRLRKPDGTTVAFNSAAPASGVGSPVLADQDPGALFCYRVPSAAGAGYIAAYSNAVAGPLPAAGGYTPFQVIADLVGDYYIEFNPTSATVTTLAQRRFNLFDITVWNNNTARTPINGRLWSLVWDIAGDQDYRQFIAEVFVYSKDSIITAVDFNGMRPINFVITANSTGCRSTGNTGIDRKSRVGNINYPEYKLFLNDPDPACFPDRQMGCLTGAVTISGCDQDNRCINIPVSRAGKVDILLDLDQSAPFGVGYDQNSRDTIISYNLQAGNNCVPWNSRDAQGNLVPQGISFGIEINYFNGNTHIPMFDAENHENGYTVRLVRPSIPTPGPGETCHTGGSGITVFWDDEAPTGTSDPSYTGGPISPVNALDGMTNLAGCLSAPGFGCHRWSNRGDNGCALNCPETMNTWWYANIIKTTTIYNVPTIDIDANRLNPIGAKNDTIVCSNIAFIPLHGIVSGDVTTGTWSTNGNGTFGSTTNFNTTYTFGSNDQTVPGGLMIFLTSTPGICPGVQDTLFVNFQPGPTTAAGPDQSACKNDPLFPLAGAVGGSTATYQWSANVAGGFFVPDAQTLNATYHPPASVTTAAGTTVVKLYLSSLSNTGSITCPAANDSLEVSYFAAPITDAGSGYTFCNTSGSPVPLSGTIDGGTNTTGFTVLWTGNGVITGGSTLTPTYQPTAAELSAGIAKVVIHVTKNTAPFCDEVTDTATISLSNPPAVGAGFDFEFCRNRVDTIPLIASVSGVTTSTVWSCVNCSGGSFLGSENTANAKYRPSTADLLLNTLQFVFTATSANCPPARDTIEVDMYSPSTVNAGSDLSTCKTAPCVNVNAVITGSGTGTWLTRGAGGGTFSPSLTSPSITYCLSDAEIALGVSVIEYDIPSDGNCLGDQDTVLIFISPSPKPFAGADKSVCDNNAVVVLSDATGAGTVTWTSLNPSPGSFNNSAPFSARNPQYTLSASEISAGSATLVMAMVTGTCLPEYDTVVVTVTPQPIVDAGPPLSVCVNNPTVTLSGSVSTATPAPLWTVVSGTTGTFSASGNVNSTFTATSPVAGGTTTLRLSLTVAGCNPVTDDVVITYTPSPVVTITSASTVTACETNPNIPVSASFTAPATGVTWTRIGSGVGGSFLPDANSASTTYVPSTADLTNGTVTLRATSSGQGNCNAVNSTTDVVVTFTDPPTAEAGTALPVCENNATPVSLSGSFSASVTGQSWTSSSGCSGCFSSTSILNPTYTPSATDIANGTVLLTLSSTGGPNGCLPVSDTVRISIIRAPTVNAGPDLIVCTNANSVALNGSSTNGGTLAWTILTGSGTVANPAAAVTSYNISATDKTNGTVLLQLSAAGFNPCASVTDQVLISFTTLPVVDAGPNRSICMNDTPFQLDASGSVGSWSTAESGVTIANPSLANTMVTVSPVPASFPEVKTFTYTAAAAAGCPAVSDFVDITLLPAPTVTASAPPFCASAASITVTANPSTGSGFWTSNGTGSFGDATLNTTTYSPSPADISAGVVILTFETLNNGLCSPVTDTARFTLTDIQISAGPDQNKCGANGTLINIPATLILNGTSRPDLITGWTETGAGTVSGTSTAAYTVTGSDVPSPTPTTITFTVNSATVNGCSDSDDAIITLEPVPTVSITPIPDVCETATTITVSGTITGVAGGTWSTTNAGSTFSPNNVYSAGQTSVSYVVGGTDPSAITFMLTTDANLCGAQTATATVNRDPQFSVNAGPDDTLCANKNIHTLTGVSINNGATGVWTASNGCTACFVGGTSFPATTGYDADTTDIFVGFVTLTLTSNAVAGNVCPIDSDKVVLRYTPGPDVDAGLDRIVCANNRVVNLVGTVNTPFSANWTTNNGGVFNPTNDLTTDFTPSLVDTTNGNSIAILTSFDPTGLCAPDDDTVLITITDAPTVTVTVPTNVCGDAAFFQLDANSNLTPNPSGVWTALIGATPATGSFTNINANSDTAVYVPSLTERTNGATVRMRFTTTNAYCASVSAFADMVIAPTPTVNITTGDSTLICANQNTITLNATFSIPAAAITWTSSGSGTIVPNAGGTQMTYTFSALDRQAGVVTLSAFTTGGAPCFSARDQYKVNIQPLPVVEAGPNVTICQNITTVSLAGASVTFANGGQWTTADGSGTFGVTISDITGTYHPSVCCVPVTDSSKASVTLRLTSTGNGVCPAQFDEKIISFTKLPYVNAGVDRTICADSLNVQLSAATLRSAGVTWSTPDVASFAPSTSILNPFFAPDTIGTYRAVIEAAGTGTCGPVRDTVLINVRRVPTLSLGLDGNICEKSEDGGPVKIDVVSLALTNATGVSWSSSGTGSFVTSPDPLKPVYTLSAQDILNGTVTISAITNAGIGTCKPVSDQMQVTIDRAPTANIGPNVEICAALGNLPIGVSAAYTNATGGTWFTSSTSGTFDDPNSDNTNITVGNPLEYEPNDTVMVSFTTIGSGSCIADADTLLILFKTNPSFTAGSDIQRCFTTTTGINIPLNAAGVAGTWTVTSGGTGTFSPDANTPNAVFTPTAGVTDNNTIVLNYDPSDACYVGTDDINVVFRLTPELTTPTIPNICETTPTVSVSSTQNAGSVLWSVAQGFGTLTNANSPSATYNVGANDKDLSTVRLFVTSGHNASFCPQDVDTVSFVVIKSPVVSAGPNQTVCSDLVNVASAIHLSGTVTNAASFSWSSANGTPITPTSLTTDFTASSLPATVTLTAVANAPCANVPRNVVINSVSAPLVVLLANKDTCARLTPLNLSSVFAVGNSGYTTGIWSRVPGNASGSFVPNATTLNGQYVPTSADTARGFVDLILTATNTGVCHNSYDDTVRFNLERQPQVSAGADIQICASTKEVPISGTMTSGPTNVVWQTGGTGGFVPTNALNTLYTLSTLDSLNGGVTLFIRTDNLAAGVSCPDDTDVVSITLSPTPIAIVNAGLDQVLCRDNPTAQLNGFILNATGGVWDVVKGGGNLSSTTNLDAVVQFTNSVDDSIILTLTSVGQAVVCDPMVDSIQITFTPTPLIYPGADSAICASSPTIQLGDSITAASVGQGVWSGGDGIFSPNKFTIGAVYTPGPNDIAAGQVHFILTSSDNGNCIGTYDSTVSTVIRPFVLAATSGTNVTCANAAGVTLSASSTTGEGIWKILSNGGSVTPADSLSTFFVPSPTDIINQSASVRFVTTGGLCAQDSVTVVVAVNPAPTVTAIPDLTVCADVINGTGVPISGDITVSSGGIWTTSGSGQFVLNPPTGTSVKTISANYIPSIQDTTQMVTNTPATVFLILKSTGNQSSGGALCQAEDDTVVITFMPRPVVAASSINTCSDMSGVQLAGSVSQHPVFYPTSSGQWSTPDGNGTFAPDPFDPNAQYVPNGDDLNKGMNDTPIHIIWSSVGAGSCNPVTDTIPMYFRLPVANAGADRITCNNLTAAISAITMDNMDEQDFHWALEGVGPVDTGQTILASTPGNYILTMTDRFGCQAKDTTTLDEYTVPVSNMLAETCYNYYLYVHMLTLPTVDPRGTIQWSYNNLVMSDENKDSVRAHSPGAYSAVYALDACIMNYDTTIVHDVPHVLTPDFIACNGVGALINIIPVNSSTITSFNWFDTKDTTGTPDATGNNPTTPLIIAPTIPLDTATHYVVVEDVNGCKTLDSVWVIGVPVPRPLINDSLACLGNTIVLNDPQHPDSNLDSLSIYFPTFAWYEDDAPLDTLSKAISFETGTTGNYVFSIQVGQCNGKDTSDLDFHPYPLRLLPEDDTLCMDQAKQTTLDAGPGVLGNPAMTDVNYAWSGPGATAADTNRFFTVFLEDFTSIDSEDNEYHVLITNEYSYLKCPLDEKVVIHDVCAPRVFPPTAFHPGDPNSMDAFFTIQGKYFTNFNLRVFNRWGEIIFQTNDANISWDGTYRGEPMPIGVYAYTIVYEGKSDEYEGPFKKDGRVVLIR